MLIIAVELISLGLTAVFFARSKLLSFGESLLHLLREVARTLIVKKVAIFIVTAFFVSRICIHNEPAISVVATSDAFLLMVIGVELILTRLHKLCPLVLPSLFLSLLHLLVLVPQST